MQVQSPARANRAFAARLSLAEAPGKPGAAPLHPIVKRTVSRAERLTAYVLGIALVLVAVAATPFMSKPFPPLPGFLLIYSTGLFMLDMMVALLLLSKARIEDNRGHLLLAVAYLYAGFIIIPHLATFPGVFTAGMLAGVSGSATWLWVFWHGGFAALIAAYALLSGKVTAGAPGYLAPLATALLLVVAAGYVSIWHVGSLPTILHGTQYFTGLAGNAMAVAVFLLNIAALIAVLATFRLRNAEELWLTVGMVGACVDVWLTLGGGGRFTLGWYCGRVCGVSTAIVLFTSLLNDVLLTYGSVAAANDVLDRLTLTDPLTSLGNRRLFDEILDKEWRRCRRENAPLTVIMLDVDAFKAYNDTYGHQAGDVCLQTIAGQLQSSVARPADMAVRYGGEEFALILPNTDSAGGEHLAQMIRVGVRDLAIPHAASANRIITVSVGVATLVPSESFGMSELVRLADIALYRAKAAGRDTVAVAG
jgi:diguanylate cyclase (GGDEF)-like protein